MLQWQDTAFGQVLVDADDTGMALKPPYGTIDQVDDDHWRWVVAFPEQESGLSDTAEEAKMEVERKMMCYPIIKDKPAIGRYNDEPYKFGEVILVRRFRKRVKDVDFTDDDGHGRPMCNGKLDSECLVLASKLEAIPEDATHVQWYNK